MVDLFAPSTFSGMSVKNHFIRSATSERLATADGYLTDKLCKVYEDLAAGGVGNIITGYARVCKNEQPSSNMMGIYDDSFVDDFQPLTRMVHGYGARIIMQIVYGGSSGQGDRSDMNIWGPSAIKHPQSGITPVEMSLADIQSLTVSFAEAALRVKAAGFDGVQIHAAHGYLLSQFLSPDFNQRQDSYGGCIENRARIIMEIYSAIREKVSPQYPVTIKINSSDDREGGLSYADSMQASIQLAQAGIDAIEVSGGSCLRVPTTKESESFFRDYAIDLAGQVNTPIILTGGNRSLDVMQQIADSSRVQYFGFSRPLMSEPGFVKKMEEIREK